MTHKLPFQFIAYLLLLCTLACNPPTPPPALEQVNNKNDNNTTMTDTFPFRLLEQDGVYMMMADIESDDLYPKYFNFFEQHGYTGNGYCWEGHIVQILEEINPTLLAQIQFDPEAGMFVAMTTSKENQMLFVQSLSPIFSDLNTLETYIKKADRSRIDD